MQIPIIIIIPTIPIEFFMSDVAPNTVSTESPKALPTTGINVDVALFIPFIVIPSTLLVNVPSNDNSPTNIVITNPRSHVTLDLKKFASFPICTLSDKFEAIFNIIVIVITGNITKLIMFPINTIQNTNIGWIAEPDATCPVAIIRAINIGTNVFINPTKFDMVSFMLAIMLTKLLIIIVTINIYSMK